MGVAGKEGRPAVGRVAQDVGAITSGMQAARTGTSAADRADRWPWRTDADRYGDARHPAQPAGDLWSGHMAMARQAAAPTAPATAPAQQFQMRPLTPTEQAQTSYGLDPATKANFAIRKAGAATPEQLQAC